jgi:AcrR family transcriptional regulator
VGTAGASRRSPGAGRELVIRAARDLFARKGYDGTSLRDIAEQAGVNESVIYRSVGTKEEIFNVAVLQPYHGFVTSFVSGWQEATERRPNAEMVRAFVHQLYDLLSEHRELITSLVSASTLTDANGRRPARSQLSSELDALATQTAADAEGRGMDGVNFDIAVRCAVGMVMSLVLLDDWLLPTGARRPTRDQLLDEAYQLILGGLERNKGAGGAC